MIKKVSIILGNQLFPITKLPFSKDEKIFMCEDHGLCTYVKHHKSKIALFFRAMRSYRESLEKNGFQVEYQDFTNKFKLPFFDKLNAYLKKNNVNELNIFEIADKKFEDEFLLFAKRNNYKINEFKSPMFLDSRNSFSKYINGKKHILMANYYKKRRKELNILVDNNVPFGGKWSFDELNREKLPKNYEIPKLPSIPTYKDEKDIKTFVEKNFSNHQGFISNLFPYNHDQADQWLKIFFKERFKDFGPYEDAITINEHFMLHSALSMLLNMGLLTPDDVITKAEYYAKINSIPINSLEGFIRQILGWREFINGIYRNFSSSMVHTNFWNHKRKLKPCWYAGKTGLPPVDDAIIGCQKYGYTHHINRLMILSNIMNMSGVDPNEIYKWFMEMFVDSSDWVMIPNVYGMGTFADGGIFSTKPYICGSSYILRMSNYKKGDWCNVVDGLYWSFIDKNKLFFSKNPRLSLMTKNLDKLAVDRKQLIYKAAGDFIDHTTYA